MAEREVRRHLTPLTPDKWRDQIHQQWERLGLKVPAGQSEPPVKPEVLSKPIEITNMGANYEPVARLLELNPEATLGDLEKYLKTAG